MELKFILESILFQAQKPLSSSELREVITATAKAAEEPEIKSFKRTKVEDIEAALEQLAQDHATAARSYRLVGVAGAWQFVSQPEYAPWLRTLVGERSRPPRLSQPALETLAIIAYRQPLTRAEIEQIRGVSVDGVMQTLIERGLVMATGRSEAIGHPTMYGTTVAFLEYFGLRGLDELPAADELRRIPVQKPESLVTVDPGLATAPPAALTTPPGDTTTASESAPAQPETQTATTLTEAPTAPAPDANHDQAPEDTTMPEPTPQPSPPVTQPAS